jgi:hypothetical protein
MPPRTARLCGAKNGIGRCRKEKVGRRTQSSGRAGRGPRGRHPKDELPRRRQRDSSLTSPITSAPTLAGLWIGNRLRHTAADVAAAIKRCPQPTLFHRVRCLGMTHGGLPVVDALFSKNRVGERFVPRAHSQLLTHWVIVINTSTVATESRVWQEDAQSAGQKTKDWSNEFALGQSSARHTMQS